ncbi:hypothetical protein DDN72_17365 [Vibrio cholerae]|nr:hypothetical protein [Vibrio cholerae]
MRPRRLFATPKEVCIALITGSLTLSNYYTLKSRAKDTDTVQYKVLVDGFKSYKLLQQIKQ